MTEPEKPKVIALNQRFAHIAFPCVLRERGAESTSFSRALAMLGGADSVRTALVDDPARFLELSFRPGEVYAHPAFAERKTSPLQLLCRVRVRGRRPRNGCVTSASATPEVTAAEAKVLGVVDASYAFGGLFDFQVVPPAQNNSAGAAADEPEPLFLPPVLFSRYDMPVEYNFQRSALAARRALLQQQQQEEGDGQEGQGQEQGQQQQQQQQQQHNQGVICVNFNDLEHGEVPREVPPWAPAVDAETDAEAAAVLEAMRAQFAARPVWSVSALTEAVVRARGAEHAVLLRARRGWLRTVRRVKLLSPHVAYYFVSGPWRTALVRLGFDPRADWRAAAYQVLDLRLFSPAPGADDADARRRTLVDHPRRRHSRTATLTQFSQQAVAAHVLASSSAAASAATTKGDAIKGDENENNDDENGDGDDDEQDEDEDDEDEEQQEQNEDEHDQSSVHKLQCSPGALQRLYCLYDVDNAYLREICAHVLADDLETLCAGGVVLRALGDGAGSVRVLSRRLTPRSGWFNDALYRGIRATLKRMVLLLEMPPRARPVQPADVAVPPQKQKDTHRNGHRIRRPAKKRPHTSAAAAAAARPPADGAPEEGSSATETNVPEADKQEEEGEEEDDNGDEEEDEDDVFGDDGLIQLLEY